MEKKVSSQMYNTNMDLSFIDWLVLLKTLNKIIS